MLTINELVRMRKLLGISGEVIADEMSTTKQTVSNIERKLAESNWRINTMSIRFYRLTVLQLIKEIDIEKKKELKYHLKNIIKYLEDEA